MKYVKNRKNLIIIVAVSVLIILMVMAVFGLQIRITKGSTYIGNSIFYPYAYTLYGDHVVLEKYQGNEQEVVLPESIWGKPVTEVGRLCFEDNDSVSKVVLNSNIEVIGEYSFELCDNLQEVVNGTNVTKIGRSAFWCCRNLETVDVGNVLEEIGMNAFANCDSLTKMETQENLRVIGEYAFSQSGLEEFSFPQSVEVQNQVFDETSWIKRQSAEFIIYGDGDLVAYSGADSCVMIPNDVKVLLGGCFDKVTADEIYVPETVTEISLFAFIECDGVKVYIPESVTTLGDNESDYSISTSEKVITIMTTQGSYAQQYAEEKGIPYEIVEAW